MTTKNQKRIKYLIAILFVIFLTQAVVTGYASEVAPDARESTDQRIPIYFLWWKIGEYRLLSIVDVQGHMVYNNEGYPPGPGGYERYAIFINGQNTYTTPTKIEVKMYVTAYYEQEWMSMCSGNVYISHFWDAPPINLVTWDGDMDYAATTPMTWTYNVGVGAQAKGFSFTFGYSYTASAYHNDYPQVNPPIADDIYRYMGYFNSIYDHGRQEFKSSVRLHVHNDVASEFGSGVTTYEPGTAIITRRILSIRIRVIFNFYSYWTNGHIWIRHGSHSHILGDGINPDNNDIDKPSIPFVPGTCN
ncbi:MAG: hypothetical protein ACFFFB_10365 [Candidatus Heimdallarchaeota archaeon]